MGPKAKNIQRAVQAANSPPGIRAFHGSPHDFDRFDASKIGTGEGAQSYGHGLYFAENPRVAEEYRSMLAGVAPMEELVVAGRRLSPGNRWNYSPRNDSIEENVLSTLLENLMLDEHGLRAAGPRANELAIETLRSRSKHYPEEWPEAVEAAASLEKKMMAPGGVRVSFGKQPGAMYEVKIGQPENSFLDWDAQLDSQPAAVRSALGNLGAVPELPGGLQFGAAGEHAYRKLVNDISLNSQPAREGQLPFGQSSAIAAERLLREGIPGIRYLDQGSRLSGDGTRNYVMFPGTEDSITILRKYGLLPAVGAGAAAQGSQQNNQQVLGGLLDGGR